MQVKNFHKSQCCRLAVVGNLCGRRCVEVKSRWGMSSYICVHSIYGIRHLMVLVYVISVINMVYKMSYREI